MLTLRPYQEAAVNAVYAYLRKHDDNPVTVIPTAGGKTPVMATICRDAVSKWSGRVMILAHVKELLALRVIDPELDVGVYSAGLKRRDTKHPIVVAGIQSVYQRACDFDPFDLVLVDECHLISLDENSMYRQFLSDAKTVNPSLRTVGFTATAFRLDSGPICGPDHFLNAICYEVGVKELIRDGYLCPLITKAGRQQVDTSGLHKRGGEFVAGEVEHLMNDDHRVSGACREIVDHTGDRQSVLIFASGVKHGQHIQRVLQETHGVECGFVCGKTRTRERDHLLGRFRSGDLKYLANINVLTVGFDAPNVDCVAMLRPTLSAGLYYQTVGRGFRIHPGKVDCLVLDFAGNVLRHGPVDQLKIGKGKNGSGDPPAKQCPECSALIAAGYAACPHCGHEFPPPERTKHETKATAAPILSTQFVDESHDVLDVTYHVHRKKGADKNAPRSMRVTYRLGLAYWQSEYIHIERNGFPRYQAERWWRRRSPDPVPNMAERAVELAEAGALCQTEKIVVRSAAGEQYDKIIGYELGPKPEPVLVDRDSDEGEVPF